MILYKKRQKIMTNFELTREEKCDIINTVVRGRRKDLENREKDESEAKEAKLKD